MNAGLTAIEESRKGASRDHSWAGAPVAAVAGVFSTKARSWDKKGGLITRLAGTSDRLRRIARTALTGSMTVLDAGAGTGGVTNYLLKVEPHLTVTALDASAEMCREMRIRFEGCSNVQIVQGDVVDHAFLEASFDLIVMNQVIHHLPEPQSAAVRIRQLMAPGARFIAMTVGPEYQREIFNFSRSEEGHDPLGRKRSSYWLDLFENAGLKTQRVYEDRFLMIFDRIDNYVEFLHQIGSLEKLGDYTLLSGKALDDAKASLAARALAAANASGELCITGHYSTFLLAG